MTSLLPLVLGLLLAGAPAAPVALAVPAAPAAAEADRRGDAGLFSDLFAHLTPHALAGVWWGGSKGLGFVSPQEFADLEQRAASEGGSGFLIYNINTVMWIACAVLLALFLPLAKRAQALAGRAPRGAFYGFFESMILFVRDDMVYAVMGKHHGQAFVPLFLTQFFFILMLNLLGLLPLGGVGGTATANLAVTAALACTTFLVINVAGIKEHGFAKHWKNFAPHGVPLPVAVFIGVLEVLLMLVKPAALMIRLFANLTAGHLIVLGLFGLTYFFGSYVIGAPVMLMAVAIYGLELFVCFVQAYIFTYLSIIFIGAAVHPEH